MPLLFCLLALAPPAGPYVPLQPNDHMGAPSFESGEPIVGTHFFYWYKRSTGEHWINWDGTDALTDHPLYRGGDYAYDRPEWWRQRMAKVREAGIDFVALVYWGLPGMDDSGHPIARSLSWSNIGARTLAQVIEEQLACGDRVIPVGMFYDTSTLGHNHLERPIELTSDWGKAWFYETIRDFFSLVPPRAWARIDGEPIVILYGADFAAGIGEDLFDYADAQFQKDFGVSLHIIKNVDWPGEADGVMSWGGALGLTVHTAAALGPGYDHSAVPGRQPLVVDREGGAFYRRNWENLLARDPRVRPRLVMVETWNELHEGTEIEPTLEYGHQYVRLTRYYADLWRAGAYDPPTGAYRGAHVIWWRPLDSRGVKLREAADGPLRRALLGGRRCIQRDPSRPGPFIYVDVDNSFAFDALAAPVDIDLTYWDGGYLRAWVEYDSLDPSGSVRAGSFKRAPPFPASTAQGWRTVTVRLNDMRFGDRCNGADLRLVLEGGPLAVAEIRVRRGQ